MEEGSSACLVLSQEVPKYLGDEYRSWHQKLVDVALDCDGLLEVNLLEPVSNIQNEWVQIFQFDTVAHLETFLGNNLLKDLIAFLEKKFSVEVVSQVIAGADQLTVPVTIVISKKVKPEFFREYMQWQKEIDKALKKYPGFLGAGLTKPIKGVQEEWVAIFRFDSNKHLDNWLNSDEHKRLVKRGEGFFEDVKIKRIGHGFEDWFSRARGRAQDTAPSQWKMAMLILLMLYPIVMVITMWLLPLVESWPFATTNFFINLLIVASLTWVAMPLITRAFNIWLSDKSGKLTKINTIGTLIIIVLYGVSIMLVAWLSSLNLK
ncbi:antibiotic biosynthesis monooxygenase [Microbulbifer sp. PAAF003]|uniref:antibiotic biosynthesis monooxygenase n=1 Tax=Microbulbifer sp. PAAF003 TaxID=3243375 RepID=UPI00403A7090